MLLKTAASGEIRDDHWVLNPVTGIYERTTLLEPAFTNLVSSDDFSAGWSAINSPTVTSGISDPANGTGGYRIEDDSAGAIEYVALTCAFTGDAVKSAVFVVREATDASSGDQAVYLYDATDAATRLALIISAWVGGKPTVSATTGTLLGVREVGNGYWALYGQTTAVTAANTNNLFVRPATTTSATGSIDVYRVNAYNATVPPQSILDASEATTLDSLSIPFTATPQESTFYTRFFESGAVKMAASIRLWQVGETGGVKTALCGQLSGGGKYLFKQHNAAGTSVTSTMGTAPDIGDLVELRCVLFSDGAVQIHQSINGAAETDATKSAALALESAWSSQVMYVGNSNAGAIGVTAFAHKGGVRAWPGVLTLEQCRTLAGVT